MQRSPLVGRTSTKIVQKIDVFISSPGDVYEERRIAERVIYRLNRMHSIADRYILRPLAYEESAPALVGQKPQMTVDRYMMEARRSDIFICILWQRMGTPVIREETGERFQSGTEYEFMDAYHANQKFGKPDILLYRGMKPIVPNVDQEQLEQVKVFFERFHGENAELKGLYKIYRSNEEFESMLFHDLDKVISHWDNEPTSSVLALQFAQPSFLREDWGEVPRRENFYGREKELTELKQWIEDDHCQIIGILGIGGVGKTTLTATLAEQIKGAFSYVYWRSLQSAPPLKGILKSCIQFLSDQQRIDMPGALDDQISLLIEYLRKRDCLLVFDNFESILQGGNRAGQYQDGYEDYGKLLQRLGEVQHHSCLLLTSREKPKEIAHLEGKTSPVRSLQLSGLGQREGQEILKDKGLFGLDEATARLIHFYSGNPLALKLVSEPVREIFGGDISAFLKEEAPLVDNAHDLLEQQFRRLSALEQEIMYWLAIEREAVSLNDVAKDIFHVGSKRELLGAVESLRRRSMIESISPGRFGLQPVIMEYMTGRLIEQVFGEIDNEIIQLLASHALTKAQAKEYVRNVQVRLILMPIAERLLLAHVRKEDIEMKLKRMLSKLRQTQLQKSGYAAGNVLSLLIQLKCELRGYDFSHLAVWQAYLQGVALPEVNFTHSNLAKSVFTETFGNILSVAFSPNGELVAAGTTDGEIRVWHVASSSQILTCQGHADWVWSVAFSPNGNMLASGSSDQTIRLWEVSTGHCLKILQGHSNSIWSIAYSSDGSMIASSSEDQTIRLWNVGSGQTLKILQGHTDRIWSVAFNAEGRTLASGSYDRTVRLWDVGTGHCLKTLQSQDRVQAVAFSPDRKTLASGSDDHSIGIWDVSSGLQLKTLQGHTNWIGSVALSPDGETLASGSYDQTVRLWDTRTGECLKILQGHTNWVGSVAFNFDGSTLASGSYDQSIRIWEVDSGQCLKTLEGYTSWVGSVALSPDGSTLVSGSENYNVRVWDVGTGQNLKVLQGHAGPVWSVAFGPDGKTIASASEDSTIKIWNVRNGQPLRTLRGHNSWARTVAFSPDGQLLASGSYDQTVRLWDVRSGHCLKVLRQHTNRIWPVIFSPDGQLLASGSEDQTIRLWDVGSGQCLKVLQGHGGWVESVVFSPDGSILASGSEDQTVRLWDVGSGLNLKILQGHTNPIKSVAFHPDGNQLASGSIDQTIKIWDISSGHCLNTLQEHTKGVWSVVFSPDGKILASSSLDGTIKLWDVRIGKCFKTLRSDRPYEGMNITHASGLTDVQRTTLKSLGAIEDEK